jgi:hypothetical protein
MSAEPDHLPSADHSPEPDRTSESTDDTIGFESVQSEEPATPPVDPAQPPSADSSPELARVSAGDTVDIRAVRAEDVETPPDAPDVPVNDQPVTQRVDLPQAEPKRRWGNLLSSERAHLLLRVEGVEQPLRVMVQERVVLGRAHPPSDIMPDVDLTPFGAHLKGVSREHVAIIFRDHMLLVEDLRSMNGSLLNGWVLMPHEPRVLRDDDQLILGRLVLFVTVIMD